MCLCDCNRRLQIPSIHPPSRGKAIAISSFAFLLDRDLCMLCRVNNCIQDRKSLCDKNTLFHVLCHCWTHLMGGERHIQGSEGKINSQVKGDLKGR